MPGYSNPLDDLKLFFRHRSVLSTLILINVSVWILSKVFAVVFFLYNNPGADMSSEWFLNYLALPASVTALAVKPWTILTYMFLHLDFLHILFNLLWLYWFGRIFLEYMNSRKLLFTYLMGGIAGGLLYILAFNVFPVFHPMLAKSLALGASASVMAIVVAISTFVPNYTIHLLLFGRVKIIYLALILFIFDFFAIPGGNSGGHLAHIGGAMWGFLYVLYLRRGHLPFLNGASMKWTAAKTNPFTRSSSKANKSGPADARPKTDDEYNAEKIDIQKKTDSILDKISKGGYDSLTKEEKAFLFKSSGKNN
jgi:membrane associated rhomboid family serine protease